MGELMETIMHRRAIRRFDTRQIEEAALQEILKAGLYAPSAGGKQGVILVVCQDKEVNERLGRIKRANSNPHMATATSYVSKEQPSIADDPNIKNAFYDAPTVITMFAPKNFLFSAEDCAVAAENMMLAADSLGIGSCYLGQGWPAFADPYGQEILKKWNIRTDYYAVMQLLLGYPREGDAHPTGKPRANDRVLRF
ncbi:MAG: nitroreductase family protein [Lachnospiraceae bacterium]|nr:nitroreductase family protein [Lachnospiraceae bacterium]